MGIGEQDVEVVAGQDQQLAAGIGGAPGVGIVVQGGVVDVAIALLIVHRDSAGDLVVDQRTAPGHGRPALAVVAHVGLRRKARVEGRVPGLDDHRARQGVAALGSGLRAEEYLHLLGIP
ncbi:hypothetical protein D3C80_1449430 [compost metagenome]